jgi:hypothetical protein
VYGGVEVCFFCMAILRGDLSRHPARDLSPLSPYDRLTS